jgi:hypothetical protein
LYGPSCIHFPIVVSTENEDDFSWEDEEELSPTAASKAAQATATTSTSSVCGYNFSNVDDKSLIFTRLTRRL